MADEVKLHSIGVLSQLTGVNTITLRAWERRYGLLKPTRTEKGHRLYSEEDIGLVREIRFWLSKGIAISKVKPYLKNVHDSVSVQRNTFEKEVEKVLDAVKHFDVNKLSTALDELIALYPMDIIMEHFLPSFEQSLDAHTAQSAAPNAESDFFFVGLRQKIRHLIETQKPKKMKGRCLLIRTSEPFDRLNLLSMASMLLSYGVKSLVIETPIEIHEVPEIVARTPFDWVVLYSNHSGPSVAAAKYLKSCCSAHLVVVTEALTPWENSGLRFAEPKLDQILPALD